MNNESIATDDVGTDSAAAQDGPGEQVLVNEEEQYCLWPGEKEVPAGWKSVFEGTHQACLDHVELVWTDMRPKSVRD